MHLHVANYNVAIRTTAISVVAAIMITIAAPVIVMAAQNNGPATDHSATVTAGEVRQALQYTPDVLSASDQSTTIATADSAIVAATAGATIEVPKDANDGVTLAAAGGPALDIGLPNASQAGDATQIAPGVIAYSSGNGAANAVQTTEDGGVRMLTIIDSPNAPTTYDYKVTVPNAGHVRLTDQGGAEVVLNSGDVIATIDAPWAKDARDRRIRTWFTTDGITLTQHVRHNVRGVVYPVTSDPWVHRWYGWDLEFNRNQTNNIMFGMIGAAMGSMWIPDPTITKIAGTALMGLGGYAGWVYNRGGCIKLRVTYAGTLPGHYFGGNCR